MATITIQVDDEVAEAYHSLSPETQSEINKIFNLFLREYFSKKSLSEVIIEIAKQAQERGLKPEILEELLEDE